MSLGGRTVKLDSGEGGWAAKRLRDRMVARPGAPDRAVHQELCCLAVRRGFNPAKSISSMAEMGRMDLEGPTDNKE